jgi:hypothetical protein
MSSSFGLRAGVQRKTKVYMEPSNNDCMAPSSAIFSSESSVHNVRMQIPVPKIFDYYEFW